MPDLAVVTEQGRAVSVLLADGAGGYAPDVRYSVGVGASGICVGDFDHDGVPDIATSAVWEPNVSVLFGIGDGAFEPQVKLPATTYNYKVTSGDLNADGIDDLVSIHYPSDELLLFNSNGDRTFQPVSVLSTPASPLGLALGLFDSDDSLDIAVGHIDLSEPGVTIYHNDGTSVPSLW